MNGSALPSDRGGSVRVGVPGVAGAGSAKWLDRITVQDAESHNCYQRHGYKILPPDATDKSEAEKYWNTVPALQDMPVNSVIGFLESGDTIRMGRNELLR
jgi:sulfite oxidase